MRPVPQHYFVEDLGRVVDKGDLVCHDVEQDHLLEVHGGQPGQRLDRVEAQLRLLVQPQELQERNWGTISESEEHLADVGLELVFALREGLVTRGARLVLDLGRHRRDLQAFGFEEWHQSFVQIDEVRVALVNQPLVALLEADFPVRADMRAYHA